MRSVSVREVPAGATLIDVREPDEFAEVHAAGAQLVPLSQFVDLVGSVPLDDGPVYVICKSGGRSAQACSYMEGALGMSDVVNVEGGTTAWVEAGLPTE